MQADAEMELAAAEGQPKKRTFRKFSYRGVYLDALLGMSLEELVILFDARAHRRFQRGLNQKLMDLIKRLRKAADAPPGEKPEPVRTHFLSKIIVPEMIGSIIAPPEHDFVPEMIGGLVFVMAKQATRLSSNQAISSRVLNYQLQAGQAW